MSAFGPGSPPPIETDAGDAMKWLTPQRIVAMTEFQGRMFLATEHRVYELIGPVWCPMSFEVNE